MRKLALSIEATSTTCTTKRSCCKWLATQGVVAVCTLFDETPGVCQDLETVEGDPRHAVMGIEEGNVHGAIVERCPQCLRAEARAK